MPLYHFSVLNVSKGILKEIRKIQRKCLWGTNNEKPKWALVSWEKVCRPKNLGGLGMRDPETFNKVFNAKIWWKWVTYKEEPWAIFWHTKYVRQWDKDLKNTNIQTI